MGTEITTRSIPAPTPGISKSLSQQQLSEHRAKIAFDVRVVLSAYFQPDDAEAIRGAQLAWWCDELQDWTQEQVLWALRDWNRSNPRKRPTPGDILAICKRARGMKYAAEKALRLSAPRHRYAASVASSTRLQRRPAYRQRLFSARPAAPIMCAPAIL